MALPVFLVPVIKFLGPIIPFIKIAALGMVKLVFLFIGSLVAPVYTFMLLNIMTVPTVIKIIKHLLVRDKLLPQEATEAVAVLNKVLISAKSKELSRSEARAVLIKMQKEIVAGIKLAFIQSLRWIKASPQRLRRWDARKTWQETRARMRGNAAPPSADGLAQAETDEPDGAKPKSDSKSKDG